MQTVIETEAYLRAAKASGMTEGEMQDAVMLVSAAPEAGDLIQGSGGLRKVRLAGKGRGKSGGYRLITYFAEPGLPVMLITMFAKGDRANLTKAERNAFARLTPRLLESLRSQR